MVSGSVTTVTEAECTRQVIKMITVGIDVSKKKLDCLWLRDLQTGKRKTRVFNNTSVDHRQLVKWITRSAHCEPDQVQCVMEATGIYHEALAQNLYDAGVKVVVENPARIKAHAKSLGARNKTDSKDSFVIAHYGVSMQPDAWQPEAKEVRELKALIARLQAVEKDLQREHNRLEKATISQSSVVVCQSIRTMIKVLEQQRKALHEEIDRHIDNHPRLKNDRGLLESIPGIGSVVSAVMLSVIHSRPFKAATECSAFLGLNPVIEESGTSLNKRSRLSKQGSAQIRAKLYMAAIVAIRHNPDIKQQYERLLRRGKAKMAALGAAMRKLVQICFGVIKHQRKYQPQVALWTT